MSIFNKLACLITVLLYLISAPVWAHGDEQAHEKEHETAQHSEHEHEHDEDSHSSDIAPDIAKASGIALATAEAGLIEKHVQVYGRLATPPTRQAQVRARFPGLVISLHANTGDSVKAGQVLAVVESNESLRRYEVKAPISGVVQERWINQGEITTDAPLFTLLDQDELWAELTIFPSQRAEVKVKQSVHVRHQGHDHNSRIISITPANSSGSALPYVLARVPLKNEHRDMVAGDKVVADIDTQSLEVPVRIERQAIQELDGQSVVFVAHEGKYEARPVKLGLEDDHYSQVLKGLSAGEQYVVRNSYLIKADIGKAAAEHSH